MLLDASACQLVLIDYQTRLMPAIHDAPTVLAKAHILAETATRLNIPVTCTEQAPAKLGQCVPALRMASGQVLDKTHFSAVQDGLAELLQQPDRQTRKHIVIAGCETHVCLLQTALDLLRRRFEVWVAADACGSRTPADKDIALTRLATAGAHLITVEMAGFEWLRDASHPAFRAFQASIRKPPAASTEEVSASDSVGSR